jgi:hypothetical protein
VEQLLTTDAPSIRAASYIESSTLARAAAFMSIMNGKFTQISKAQTTILARVRWARNRGVPRPSSRELGERVLGCGGQPVPGGRGHDDGDDPGQQEQHLEPVAAGQARAQEQRQGQTPRPAAEDRHDGEHAREAHGHQNAGLVRTSP